MDWAVRDRLQIEQHQRRQDHTCGAHLAAVQPFPEQQETGNADDQDHPHTVRGINQERRKFGQSGQQEAGGKEVGPPANTPKKTSRLVRGMRLLTNRTRVARPANRKI